MNQKNNKCIILPFGFDPSIVFRTYSRFSLDDGDRIILISTLDKNPRKEAAIKDVEAFLKNLNSRGININFEIREVDASDIGKVVLVIAELIEQDQNRKYFIDASAGVRSLCVALTIVAILMRPYIMGFFTIDESTNKTVEVKLPSCMIRLTNTKQEIMKLINRNNEMKAREIARILGKDLSTIHRHLVELLEANYLECDTSYDAHYRLTYFGILALKI